METNWPDGDSHMACSNVTNIHFMVDLLISVKFLWSAQAVQQQHLYNASSLSGPCEIFCSMTEATGD